jgi:hypothetical protein
MVEYRTFRGAMPQLIVIVIVRGSGEMLSKVQYEIARREYESLCRAQYRWEIGKLSNSDYYRILVKRS